MLLRPYMAVWPASCFMGLRFDTLLERKLLFDADKAYNAYPPQLNAVGLTIFTKWQQVCKAQGK